MKFIGITQRIIETKEYVELRECLALDWGEFFLWLNDTLYPSLRGASETSDEAISKTQILRHCEGARRVRQSKKELEPNPKEIASAISSPRNDDSRTNPNATAFNDDSGCDFLPLPLSCKIPFEKYAPNLCAVIFSGGNDLNTFSKNPLSAMRDSYEKEVLEICIKRNIPVLGICRGAQFIAQYFGSKISPCQNHSNTTHDVFSSLDSKKFSTNSYHNFAISKLGENLESLAIDGDKNIEAFKHKSLKIFALMWHIERENGLNNTQILKTFLSTIKEQK